MKDKPTETFDLSIYNVFQQDKHTKHEFQIMSKNSTRKFISNSRTEALDWIAKLQDSCLYQLTIDIKITSVTSSIFQNAIKHQLKVVAQNLTRTDDYIKYRFQYIKHLTIRDAFSRSNIKFLKISGTSKFISTQQLKCLIQNAVRIYRISDIDKYGLTIDMKMGYLERKPVWNIHNKGLTIMLTGQKKYIKFVAGNFKLVEKGVTEQELANWDTMSVYEGYNPALDGRLSLKESTSVEVTVEVVNNSAFNCELFVDAKHLNSIDDVICDKVNAMYFPTAFEFISCKSSESTLKGDVVMQKKHITLKVKSYKHVVSTVKITCPHLVKSDDSKNSDDMFQLKCPIYKAVKIKYNYSEDNLKHLIEHNHFKDEFVEKQPCRYYEKCKATVRLENGENRLDDRCHVQLYRHPPRNRQ
eukprot:447432_1